MVSKFFTWNYKFYSLNCTSRMNSMDINKCYFRYIKSEERVDISFRLKINDGTRQFNFTRKPSEVVESVLTRVANNINKFANKGNKKKGNVDKIELDVKLYDNENQQISQNVTCLQLFDFQNPVKLKICNQIYEVVFNSPWVVSVCLPRCILTGFPVYPEDFVTYYTDKDKSIFNWYKGLTINDKGNTISDMHIKWNLIASGFIYTPVSQDIGMKLKLECIPGNDKTNGPAVETVSKSVVEAGPGKCPFEVRHMFTQSKLKDKSFRCVSYNILADLYCDSDHTRTVLYPYCPPYALHIDYRKQLIMKELLGYNADIVCLQEVDRKIFHNYLKPFLEYEGLVGAFYKKGKEVAEGLACFYRKDRFSLLDQEQILLAEALRTKPYLESIWRSVKDNVPLLERLLDRSTIASTTILKSHDNTKEILIIANTHLYFHPDADHIRLIQGGIIIYWLQELRKQLISKYPENRISLIIFGDFNSIPSCGIYQLYTTGIAPSYLSDWKSNINEGVENLTLKQDILLESGCGTPEYTNFTNGFADCLDYIFYEKQNIAVEQVVPFPDIEELKAHTALPSIVFPSDHIALISDLRFI